MNSLNRQLDSWVSVTQTVLTCLYLFKMKFDLLKELLFLLQLLLRLLKGKKKTELQALTKHHTAAIMVSIANQ